MQDGIRETASAWIVGIMMTAFGLLGLVLAAGARDDEMSIFGWSLSGFAAVFIAGLVRAHYDAVDAAKARAGRHG